MKLGHGQDTETDLSERKKKRWTTEMDCAQGWGLTGVAVRKVNVLKLLNFLTSYETWASLVEHNN